MKKFLAFLLALTMILSVSAVLVSAFEVEPNAKLGFLSDRFNAENSYEYADDEVVTAIVIASGDPAAEYGAVGSRAANARVAKLNKQHCNIFKAMQNADVEYSTLYEYTSLLNGFAVKVEYGGLKKIAALPDVEAVYISNRYKVPDETVDTVGSGIAMGSSAANGLGYTGAGTVVAVIDTGLNYWHEAFGDYGITQPALTYDDVYELSGEIADGRYISEKIPFSYDYADGDGDVYDTVGHGTHVSGIAVGYAESYGDVIFSGAAPAAQLVSMKVFSDYEEYTESAIYFKALEDAYTLGVDVINMSLGSVAGFTYDSSLDEDVLGNIFAKIDEAGIILCASAGNQYSQGFSSLNLLTQLTGLEAVTADYADYGIIGSPASYLGNLSIASAENATYVGKALLIGDSYYGYYENDTDNPFYNYYTDDAYDYVIVPNCGEEADYEGLDAEWKIAVVTADVENILAQADAAAVNGAIAVIFVCENSYDATVEWLNVPFPIPALFVEAYVGDALVDNAEYGEGTLYADSERQIVVNPDGGVMSDFSSRGVTSDLAFGPMVTGIGGYVYSAYIENEESYVTMSGTSMASPNVAGNMAIVLQYLKEKYPELSRPELAELAEALVESTAEILFEGDAAYSPSKQGAGLVNSFNAVSAEAYIVNPIESLYDDPERTGVFTVSMTVKNLSDEAVVYDVEYEIIRDLELDGSEYGLPGYYNLLTSVDLQESVDYTADGANSVTVPAGETAEITLTFTLTDSAKAFLDECFEYGAFVNGFVTLVGRKGEVSIHKSFIGFYGDWTEAPMLEKYDTSDLCEFIVNYMEAYGVSEDEAYEAIFSTLNMNVGYGIIASCNIEMQLPIGVLGMNLFSDGMIFSRDYMSISTDPEATADGIYVLPALLRNAEHVIMAVSNSETGEIYYFNDIKYAIKNVYYEGEWYGSSAFIWDGTDTDGNPVASGAEIKVEVFAYTDYEKLPAIEGDTYGELYENLLATGQESQWTFDLTVDSVKPELVGDIQIGDETVSATFADDKYLAYVAVLNEYGDAVLEETYADNTVGVEHTVSFEKAWIEPGVYTVVAVDYATNLYQTIVYVDDEMEIHTFDPETGFCVDGDCYWCSEDGVIAYYEIDDDLEVVDVYFTGIQVERNMEYEYDEYGYIIGITYTGASISLSYPMSLAANAASELGYGVTLWLEEDVAFDFTAEAAEKIRDAENGVFTFQMNIDYDTDEFKMVIDPCGLDLSDCPAYAWFYGRLSDDMDNLRIYAFDADGNISNVEYTFDEKLLVLTFKFTEPAEYQLVTADASILIVERFAESAEKYAESAKTAADDAQRCADDAAASEAAAAQAKTDAENAEVAAEAAQAAAEAAQTAAEKALSDANATKADVDAAVARADAAKTAAETAKNAAETAKTAAETAKNAAEAAKTAAEAAATQAKADAEAAARAKAEAEAAKAAAEAAKADAEAAKTAAEAAKVAAETAKSEAEQAKADAAAEKSAAEAAKTAAEAAKTAAEQAKSDAESKANEVGNVKTELETRLDEAEALVNEAKAAVENGGCKSTIAAGAIFAVLGLAFTAIRRKKD